MLLFIDNYDSFVYNLSRYFVELGCETQVVRNDAISVSDVRAMAPEAIVISPGPCTPTEAGISIELISKLSDTVPMLGVCLGHQAIAAAFGGRVVRAPEPIHGRSSLINHAGTGLFNNLPSPLRVGRYHSLIVADLPPDLVVTAATDDGIPMAIEHRTRKLYGVQFHPESVLTQHGRVLLANFAKLAGMSPKETQVADWIEPPPAHDEQHLPLMTW